jgi:hypothetical protein
MPIDERRRNDIAAAVAAYASVHPDEVRLPRRAVRLLAVMFPVGDVCRRSLDNLAGEGFDRRNLPGMLRRLTEAGFLSKEEGRRGIVSTYRLHLPPERRP